MKKKLQGLFLLLISITFLSCSDEMLTDQNQSWQGSKDMLLTLNAAHYSVSGESRSIDNVDEGTSSDYTIKDFVLFQFDENGRRIVDPKYYKYQGSNQTIPIVMPTGDKKYTVFLLANLHQQELVSIFSDAITIDLLAEKYRTIQNPTDTYQTSESTPPSYDLMMNGYQIIDQSTPSLNITLYRNVAKLTLVIDNSNSGSGVTIKTAQVKDISTKLDYFYQYIQDKKSDVIAVPYPSHHLFTTFDYPTEQLELAPGAAAKTLTYYLPCHLMGSSASTSDKTKGNYAPDYATYIELYGKSMGAEKFVRYRFYLGDNMTNDYNIRPNYHYEMNLTFNGLGDPSTDARVTHMDAVVTEPEANCYMLHPLPTGEQPLYNIPIASRINKFWGEEFNAGHIASSTAYTIGETDQWVAEIIWQTSDQQLIEFYDKDGITGHGGKVFPTYKGQVPLKVKPKAGAQGNVLIGVYRKGITTNDDPSTREYSWSWHLWITDYNPDECRNQNWGNRYIDVVPEGEVHHYVGELWDADDAKYHNKWIMDRNLGSLHSDGHAASMGLFYQFGRKDPLPYKGNVYTFNSNYEISSQTISPVFVPYSNTNTLDYIVKHPQFYYRSPSGDGGYSDGQEYIASNPYSSSLWNDPNWNKREGRTEKSFFDPCPPGWRIPEYNIWSGLKSYEGSYEGFILYCDNIKGSDNTCRYYAYGSMGNSLNYIYMTTSASYFSSTPVENSKGGAYGMRNHQPGIFQTGYLGAYTGRQRGNQIRPIQE